MKEEAISECESLISECVSPKRTRKMVQVFDNLSNSLCKVADLAEFIRVAHPVNSYALAAENACLSVSQLVEK